MFFKFSIDIYVEIQKNISYHYGKYVPYNILFLGIINTFITCKLICFENKETNIREKYYNSEISKITNVYII